MCCPLSQTYKHIAYTYKHIKAKVYVNIGSECNHTDLFTHPVDMVGHVHKGDISMEI